MAKHLKAKSHKMSKKLIFVFIIIVAIIIVDIKTNFSNTIMNAIRSQIEAYNAKSIVHSAFTKNGVKYIPVVYKHPEDILTKETLEKEFENAGLEIKSMSSSVIGTGTKITTEKETYTLLIYGDVDGDGQINVRDVRCIVRYLVYGNQLPTVNMIAADVSNVNSQNCEIDVRDAQKIVRFILGKEKIIDTIPAPDAPVVVPPPEATDTPVVNPTDTPTTPPTTEPSTEPTTDPTVTPTNPPTPGAKVSSIKYKDIVTNLNGYCYDDIITATVVSGESESKLTNKDVENIGCIVTKNGEPSKYILSKGEGLGISKTISDGAVTISFWAKDAGEYSIIPYILVDGERKEVVSDNPAKVVVISENNTVNKISFVDEAEGTFGKVDIGDKEIKTIKFYHNYEKAMAKTNKADIRSLTKVVTRNMVFVSQLSSEISNVELGYIDNTGAYVFGTNNPSDYITHVRVTIKNSAVQTQNAEFSISVDGFAQQFKVNVSKGPEADKVIIGTDAQNTVKLYLEQPTDSQYETEIVDGIYYTIYPITFMSGTTKLNSTLQANMIDSNKYNINKDGYLVAVDNANESNENGTAIKVLGFNLKGNKYVKAEGEEIVNYIGIAYGREKQNADYFLNPASQYYINKIKIYYNKFGLIKEFTVTSDYSN